MTGGLRGTPYLSTLVVAQAHVSATARVDYHIADSFPAGRSGRSRPSDQGLAECHPVGCGGEAIYSQCYLR